MTVEITANSLVLLIGPSGSGKSTFARRWFLPTQVVSSDRCRAWISDDEGDQSVSRDAFEILNLIAAKRLALAKLTVIDATNVTAEGRRPLLEMARAHGAVPVAIVFDLPVARLLERNGERPGRIVETRVIEKQAADLAASLPSLEAEGFAAVYRTGDPDKTTVTFR